MYSIKLVNDIKRKYNKYDNGIELLLVNYEGLNYYIRIDKDRFRDIYYLHSFDLNIMDKYNKRLVNRLVIPKQSVDYICDLLSNQIIKDNKSDKHLIHSDDNLVHFKANIDYIEYDYSFQSFIPLKISFLADIMYVIFNNLPNRLFDVFNELIAKLNKTENKYLYKKPFKFDLFKGSLDKVFSNLVIQRGENYYLNKQVRYLEKINKSYYSVVESDNALYTVIIDYDNKDKTIKMTCNCTCEFYCKHMYATIKAIRNKEFFKFYKVRYIDENATYYDKIFSNNYFLCLDIQGDKLFILYPNGEIHPVFIFDKAGNSMFEVVEDSQDNYLTNKIKDAESKRN